MQTDIEEESPRILEPLSSSLEHKITLWRKSKQPGNLDLRLVEKKLRADIFSLGGRILPELRQRLTLPEFAVFARGLGDAENFDLIANAFLSEEAVSCNDDELLENLQVGLDHAIFELRFLKKDSPKLEDFVKRVMKLKRVRFLLFWRSGENGLAKTPFSKHLTKCAALTGLGVTRDLMSEEDWFSDWPKNENSKRYSGDYFPPEYDLEKIPDGESEKMIFALGTDLGIDRYRAKTLARAVKAFRRAP